MSTNLEVNPIVYTRKQKIALVANECIGLPVQRYVTGSDYIFENNKFNGCLAFVKFVLMSAGVPIPDFIGPDYIQRKTIHVNEMYDHFGLAIPNEKSQEGDLVFFSWDGIRPLHIGIVSTNNTYIHAYTKGGIVQRNDLRTYPINTSRVSTIYNTNPIGYKRPTLPSSHPRWFQIPID